MISRDELLVQAEAFDLSEANVQRDYVFGWIISGIFRESSLAGRATLKGATRSARATSQGRGSRTTSTSPRRTDSTAMACSLN